MDTPVMLLFFNRPECVRKSFAWICNVKPKKLFLIQDGPRENHESDRTKVMECRKIVENIDWECEVKRRYSLVNLGCDQNEYTGIDWCFEQVDRLLILEDDCVPAISFYNFCAELLSKYEDDKRIGMISGFVRCKTVPNCEDSYTVSHTSAGIGWATWKRFWNDVKKIEGLGRVEYAKVLHAGRKEIEEYCLSYKGYVSKSIEIRNREMDNQCIYSWENIVGLALALNSYLVISPKNNMIKYAGIGEDATHSTAELNVLPAKIREMFSQDAHEVAFPLNHPQFLIRNMGFEMADYKQYFGINPYLLKVESVFRRIKVTLRGKKNE